jgi:hypothetical protein
MYPMQINLGASTYTYGESQVSIAINLADCQRQYYEPGGGFPAGILSCATLPQAGGTLYALSLSVPIC